MTLVLTGTINRAVNRQRKTFVFDMRLPEHANALKEICSEYLHVHDDVHQSDKVRHCLFRIKTELELLVIGAPGSIARDMKKIIRKTNKYYKNHTSDKRGGRQVSRDDLFSVYTETHGVITKLDELIKTKGYGY